MTEKTNDPWAAAKDAEPRQPIYWGNLVADAYFVILEKGIGRLPFDPEIHPPGRRCTAVDLSLLCITEQNMQTPIERQVIAESGEWTKFIKPSILELGFEPQELNGRFVKVKMVPTGRKYTNSNGEEREASTFKFLEVFADENECIADYLSGEVEEPEEETELATQPAPAAQPQAGNGNENGEKETALQFLKVLVDSAVNGQTDLKVVQKTLAGSLETTPLVAKYFTVDSPETMELIMQGMKI